MQVGLDSDVDETDGEDDQVGAVVDRVRYQSRLDLTQHAELARLRVRLHHRQQQPAPPPTEVIMALRLWNLRVFKVFQGYFTQEFKANNIMTPVIT